MTVESFKKYLRECENTDYDTMLAKGKKDFTKLVPYIDAFVSKKPGCLRKFAKQNQIDINNSDTLKLSVLLHIISVSVVLDGEVKSSELKYIKDLFGPTLDLNAEQLVVFYSSSDANGHDIVNEFIDSLDRNGKFAFLDLITCFFAIDRTIGVYEQKTLATILAKLQ